MSKENVELVRGVMDSWNRGERDLSSFHPDVEWLPLRTATEGAYRGIAGIERFIADTDETFDKFELRQDVHDPGDRIVAWGPVHVRGGKRGARAAIPAGGGG